MSLSEEMRELYQEVILQHKKQPRNHHAMDDATAKQDGFNPLCGDQVTVYVRMDDDRIADVSFEGVGCAISTASASMMTEALKGKSREEASTLFHAFHQLVTEEDSAPDRDVLGKLTVFSGVWEFPSRIKCATLPWHTLRSALQGEGTVSTE